MFAGRIETKHLQEIFCLQVTCWSRHLHDLLRKSRVEPEYGLYKITHCSSRLEQNFVKEFRSTNNLYQLRRHT
jgi:hypothetical protein